MGKVIGFSLFSIALAVGVICWVAGTAGRTADHERTAKPAKVDAGQTPPAASEDGLSVYFSPNGGCTEAIIREIQNAKTSIYVQAAQFTSAPIAKALVAAHNRGVDVRVILDGRKDDSDHSQVDRLVDGGVPAFADEKHHTAHNKVMLIDHHLLFTGSFNFTKESESENAENLLRIDNKPNLFEAYEENFKAHLAHSTPYAK